MASTYTSNTRNRKNRFGEQTLRLGVNHKQQPRYSRQSTNGVITLTITGNTTLTTSDGTLSEGQ